LKSVERADTVASQKWALGDRPVSEPAGVYTSDGQMATLRTGDARMAE
jgi:hypothetical protein